jgi:hypothetical protein
MIAENRVQSIKGLYTVQSSVLNPNKFLKMTNFATMYVLSYNQTFVNNKEEVLKVTRFPRSGGCSLSGLSTVKQYLDDLGMEVALVRAVQRNWVKRIRVCCSMHS